MTDVYRGPQAAPELYLRDATEHAVRIDGRIEVARQRARLSQLDAAASMESIAETHDRVAKSYWRYFRNTSDRVDAPLIRAHACIHADCAEADRQFAERLRRMVWDER